MRILVIQLKAIGDVICTTPIPAYLKKVFPDAEVDFLVGQVSAPVVETSPFVANTLVYDASKPLREISRIRSRRYDVVIDYLTNPRTRVLTLASGARWKIAFDRGLSRSFYYNFRAPVPSEPEYVPVRKLRLIDEWFAKIKVPSKKPEFVRPKVFLNAEDEAFAEEWIANEGLNGIPFAIVMPIHKHPICRWQPEGFRQVATDLVQKLKLRVYFGWGPGEEQALRKVHQGLENLVGLCPPVSLRKNAAILKRATFLLANNSGSIHLAVSVGTPTVAIFGPTRAIDWSPALSPIADNGSDIALQAEGLECLGCRLKECPIGHLCMKDLSADTVLAACNRMVSDTRSARR